MAQLDPVGSESQGKRSVARAIEQVAEGLGNTPAVARRAYVHPGVIEAYLEGDTLRRMAESADEPAADPTADLVAREGAVLALLRRRPRPTRRRG
jgi:DNA topoisomerase-1